MNKSKLTKRQLEQLEIAIYDLHELVDILKAKVIDHDIGEFIKIVDTLHNKAKSTI